MDLYCQTLACGSRFGRLFVWDLTAKSSAARRPKTILKVPVKDKATVSLRHTVMYCGPFLRPYADLCLGDALSCLHSACRNIVSHKRLLNACIHVRRTRDTLHCSSRGIINVAGSPMATQKYNTRALCLSAPAFESETSAAVLNSDSPQTKLSVWIGQQKENVSSLDIVCVVV